MKDPLALFGLTATPAAASEADAPRRPVTRRRLARDQYTVPPSFTDLLPWCEYLPEHQAFLLEDGRSVGTVLEITPVGCEARPPSFMAELHQGLLGMLSNVLEIDPSPWVVQVYVQDETDLRTTSAALRNYIRPELRDSTLTRHWLAVMEAHLFATARPGGVFDDSVVTHWRWGGKLRRTRLVVYRRFRREEQPLRDSLEQLRDQVGRLRASLDAAGVSSRIADGEHVYDWLLQWFNPRPGICDGDSTRLADIAPYPGDRDLPFGRDFAELLTLSVPRSDTDATCGARSEERRVGKECTATCRSRWSPYH